MTTVVNNTSPVVEKKASNFYMEAIFLLGFALLILYFGIPAINRMRVMLGNNPVLNINVPDKINININQEK
jgi:hypothetical protein